jgi:hypothetical protein
VPQSALQWGSMWPASGPLGWCLWNFWDCLITNIEIVLQETSTILSAVEGRTR